MTVKRSKLRGVRVSEPNSKDARLSLRVHDDLRSALEFLADHDRRKLSQYIEVALLDHCAALLANTFNVDGSVDGGPPFRLRTPSRR